MKPQTNHGNTKIFYYILPPIILLIIIVMIYHNATPPPPVSPNSDGELLNAEISRGNADNDPTGNQTRETIRETPISTSSGNREKERSTPKPNPAGNEPSAPFTVTNSRAITAKDEFIAPRFSPDGLDVICSKANYKGIYLVSSDGSEIRQLSDEFGIGYDVRWSEDGTKLIIKYQDQTKVIDLTGEEIELSEEEMKLLLNEKVYSRDNNIYMKDSQSGEEVSITGGEDSYYSPSMSPDGSKIAYQGLTSGIHIRDVETGEVIDLGQGSNFHWLPDGSGLVYNYTQDDGLNMIAGDVYFAYADGSGVFNITNTPDVIELNPALSPDGRYVTYEIDGQVFVADLMQISK
ncbi:PD40 domain-containing protein [Candidatus Sumerlaeota bacterium]|nr:PD40 domain-containing protein [Candidatus Sumerlaeota bacterium]